MELELKKAKITKSILSQTRTVDIYKLKEMDILGVIYLPKELPIILLYSQKNKCPFKYPLYKNISIEGVGKIKVKLGGNYVDLNYEIKDIPETQNIFKSMSDMKEIAIEIGQIFI